MWWYSPQNYTDYKFLNNWSQVKYTSKALGIIIDAEKKDSLSLQKILKKMVVYVKLCQLASLLETRNN